MKYSELEPLVVKWADEKGLLAKGNPMAQGLKTLEEVGEMLNSINKGDRNGLIDDFGDILVTIIIQAEMNHLSLEACLEVAYNEIKGRRGTIQNGTFVKE